MRKASVAGRPAEREGLQTDPRLHAQELPGQVQVVLPEVPQLIPQRPHH